MQLLIINNMKKYILILCSVILGLVSANAQTKAEKEVTAKVNAIHKAIFVDKDSASLNKLLATEVTYGHSGGKLTDRKQTLEDIGGNKSVYSDIEIKDIKLVINGNTVVSRYVLTGTETKEDGKAVHLNLGIMMVWIKEKGEWKMMARQATKLS